MRSARTSVARQLALILILVSVPLALVGCGDQMAKMEANQLEIEAMVAANARQIATISSQIHNSQSKLDQRLTKLDENTKAITSQVASVQDQQNRLQGAVVSSERSLSKQIRLLEQNQGQLRDGVTQVADISQKTNAAVGAVARDQATLHDIVQGHKNELDGQIVAIAKSQEQTHAGIAKLSQADSDLADRIAAVSHKQSTLERQALDNRDYLATKIATLTEEQQALEELTTRNHANLTSHLATVTKNQEQTQAGIANLQQADRDLAGKIAVVTNQQNALRELATTNQQELTGKIAAVASEQQALAELTTANQDRLTSELAAVKKAQAQTHGGIANLQKADQDINGKLVAMSATQATLQQLTTENRQQLSNQITTVAEAQETTQSEIAKLQQTDEDITGKLTAMSQTQQSLRDLANANQQQLNGKIEAISQEQATLRELTANNHKAVTNQVTSVVATQQKTQAGLAELKQADDGLSQRIATVAQEQTALRELTSNNHAKLTSHIAAVAKNQEQAQIGISKLQDTDQDLTGKIVAMSQAQMAMQELTSNNHKAITGQVTALSEGQSQLRSDVGELRSKTNAVATDLTAVTKEQAAIRETLNTASVTLAEKLALVETNQGDIQSLIDRVANTADQTSQDVTTLAANQATIQQRQKANNEMLNNQLAVVTKSQQYATEHLDAITETAVQLSLDVLSLEESQNNIEQVVQNNHQVAAAGLASLSEGQQAMQTDLGKVATTAEAVSRDVVTLSEKQAQLATTFQGTRDEFATALDAITNDQKTMQGQLNKVVTTGEELNRQINTLDKKQSKIEQTIQGTRTEFTAALASVTQGQWAVQGDLEKVTAKTNEVATEMQTLGQNQGKLEEAIAGARGEFTTALTTVNENQASMRGQLNQVATANEKVAVEVDQLDKNQVELTNTVKANREELVTRLNEIALGQQQWLTRFDATEAKVDAMTTSLTSLEQRVSKLQGTLQNSLTELNTLLDARADERATFEETVRQDVQGVTDSVADLADVQAGLAEDIQQVRTETQSQSQDILSTLRKLQEKAEAKSLESVEQIKSSKADLEEVILP